ncbi:hypothetical protein K432DRAFT_229778 [Lepidopterella palustris CBS 459.81]|uniref:Uncharacterized protein n=1 Tax=Lepidopterella palustris CBS 459.81 TaxID=1314670 RepID=A0A8E2EE42_9PEZI|nr:hypothetical protein K432DRAFT_229778 [Lepidopterella palustris CBS 459.81]
MLPPGFGWSPGDLVKLIELSTRVYSALADAQKNSSNQVKLLVKEFNRFHEFLKALSRLLERYGRPLPFGSDDFKETLKECEKFIQPYADALIDRRPSITYAYHAVKFVSEDKDVERLRKQVDGHVQSLKLYIGYLTLELQLEAEQQGQLLSRNHSVIQPIAEESALDFSQPYESQPRKRPRTSKAQSFAAPSQSEERNAVALPDPESEDLCQELLRFKQYLEAKDDKGARRIGEHEGSSALSHLRREVDIALERAENRAKRVTAEEIAQRAAALVMRGQSSPNDDEVRGYENRMPITTSTGCNANELRPVKSFGTMPRPRRADSHATYDSAIADVYTHDVSNPTSPTALNRRATDDPDLDTLYQNPRNRSSMPSPRMPSPRIPPRMPSPRAIPSPRPPSVDSSRVSYASSGKSSDMPFQWPTNPSFPNTPMTSPPSKALQPEPIGTFAKLDLPPAALDWTCISDNAKIEYRNTKGRQGPSPCIINHAFRFNRGLSIRAVLKSDKGFIDQDKDIIKQEFPNGQTPIPLAVHNLKNEKEVFISFPQGLCGYIGESKVLITQYTLQGEDSKAFQSILYGQELMFSKNIRAIHSDKYKEECKTQSLRLWKNEGVLTLLFYTNTRPEKKNDPHCWVEEPHTAFERLKDSEISKKTDKLTLRFSRKPKEHEKSKLKFGAKDKGKNCDDQSMRRISTFSTVSSASSTISVSSNVRTINRHGFNWLEIEFKSREDRKLFVDVWQAHVPRLVDFS